jgi:hypothetical protein
MIQTNLQPKHKRGDVREDGYIFRKYRKRTSKTTSEVKILEEWASPAVYEREKETACKRAKDWQKANPEKAKARLRKWQKANPERCRAFRYEWQKANPDKHKEASRNWQKANQDKVNEIAARRRARERQTSSSLTHDEKLISRAIYGASRRISECIGIQHHIDHIVPIARGGAHHPSNLQILPALINHRKSAKLDFVCP